MDDKKKYRGQTGEERIWTGRRKDLKEYFSKHKQRRIGKKERQREFDRDENKGEVVQYKKRKLDGEEPRSDKILLDKSNEKEVQPEEFEEWDENGKSMYEMENEEEHREEVIDASEYDEVVAQGETDQSVLQ